ncbi:MAG: hypothetical protein KF718_31885 [Polyangiaceae bacterium]|nr:hypothetical protein [Polyangiaceae bacterium]
MHRACIQGAVVLALLSGCGEDPAAAGADAVFTLPESLAQLDQETFFDHPWPSDWRREADGTVRFAGWPNPRQLGMLVNYADSMAGVLHGFSPAAAGFLRFTAALDPKSLPASSAASTSSKSSVQLIDVDPASPTRGARHPIDVSFRPIPGVYIREHTLSFMPALGHPLRPSTRYALVVTRDAATPGGGEVRPSRELSAVLGLRSGSVVESAVRDAWAPALEELAAAGVGPKRIAHLAVFTTNSPATETEELRDFIVAEYPAPDVEPDTWVAVERVGQIYDLYEGRYGPSPDFQQGSIPFAQYGDGGTLAFDDAGTPVVQREFSLRFALAVPSESSCPMPAAGYPIVLYAHGTGGDYRSMLGNNREARALALECVATMGIDQIFHGDRPGASGGTPDLLFFNVQNPLAARANGPQSALDVVQQARLFTETQLRVPAAIAFDGAELRFDPDRVGFFGHSQGGINGPLYLAVDDSSRGGVLSASGSLISIALLEKTKPFDIQNLVRAIFLALGSEEYEELGLMHPAISLAQTIVDPTDPVHYVHRIVRAPRPGFSAKSVLMTEGVNPDGTGDSYTPPRSIAAQAFAMGLPLQQPVIFPHDELGWGELSPLEIPAAGLSGNLAGGAASGVLAQWPASQASDGHFVIYGIPAAMKQASGFVRHLMDEPAGRVPPP